MDTNNTIPNQKCGFVAVLGQPNAGKSTLVNCLVGSKVSIVSPKVQTTRRRILGITIHKETQLILIDTPGIFAPSKTLETNMVKAALDASGEGDLNLLLVDVKKKTFTGDFKIIEGLSKRVPLWIAFNKVDLIPAQRLLEIAKEFQEKFPHVGRFFMISAKTGSGTDTLLEALASKMPLMPWMYEEDQLTDLPLRLWAAEITREQLVLQLQQELPYETYVETEQWETFHNGSVKIGQKIVVARAGQKGIILGKAGAQIKAISQKARHELEKHLGHKVHLFVFVKVTENWMEKPSALKDAGLG
jgi:GTP-binding protein Era